MARVQKRKRKIRKLKIKVLLKIFLFLLACVLVVYWFCNIRIKNIYIYGNNNVKDVDIIRIANIQDYPRIFKINKKKMEDNIKSLPLISDVKLKRNIFGKFTIEVVEKDVYLYYMYDNKYICSDNTFVEEDDYEGIPVLVNFTPDTVLEYLINGMGKVDVNVIKMINQITYEPYKDSKGKVIDENRFKLLMNDGNTVYMDTANIKNLNKYSEIYASLNMDVVKGVLYLDTITDENVLFESYESIKQTENALAEAQKKKEEEANSPDKNEDGNDINKKEEDNKTEENN